MDGPCRFRKHSCPLFLRWGKMRHSLRFTRRCIMRVLFLTLSMILAGALGCGRQNQPGGDGQPEVKVDPKPQPQPDGANKNSVNATPAGFLDPAQPSEAEQRDKYEAALAEALNLLADQKWQEALVALEAARTFQDNDFIQGEITRVKGRIDQQAAAQKTVQNL